MSKIHYLTVQDMLWINLQVVQKVVEFDYARLEDGTFFQYGYGGSTDVAGQGINFLRGFAPKKAFEAGNDATGFVAFVAFLRINGFDLAKSDAEGAAYFSQATSDAAIQSIVPSVDGHHDDHLPSVAEVVRQVMANYPVTIAALAEAVPA